MTKDFVIEKIVLKTGVSKILTDYYSNIIRYGDTCSRFVYAYINPGYDTIRGTNENETRMVRRKTVADTLNISDIKMLFYKKEEFDGGSLAFVLTALLIVPVGYGIIWLLMHPR